MTDQLEINRKLCEDLEELVYREEEGDYKKWLIRIVAHVRGEIKLVEVMLDDGRPQEEIDVVLDRVDSIFNRIKF